MKSKERLPNKGEKICENKNKVKDGLEKDNERFKIY